MKTRFDIKDWFVNPEHQRTPCTYEFFASTLWAKIESAMKWLIEIEERYDELRQENIDFRKQVDKLNKRLIARESLFNNLVIVEKDNSVKDTAKEILGRLKCYGDRDEALRRHLLDIEDDYGVEVQE